MEVLYVKIGGKPFLSCNTEISAKKNSSSSILSCIEGVAWDASMCYRIPALKVRI